MLIEDVMTRDVHYCRASDPLNEAARIMWDGDCGCVPVVDGEGACIGMLTDRDICMATYLTGKTLHELRAVDAMARDVVSCLPHHGVGIAEALMQRHQVRRLPVLSFGNRVVGIVSLNDLARAVARPHGHDHALSPAAIEETLAAVCAPRPAQVATGS